MNSCASVGCDYMYKDVNKWHILVWIIIIKNQQRIESVLIDPRQ
jgi:hypothetical protein